MIKSKVSPAVQMMMALAAGAGPLPPEFNNPLHIRRELSDSDREALAKAEAKRLRKANRHFAMVHGK